MSDATVRIDACEYRAGGAVCIGDDTPAFKVGDVVWLRSDHRRNQAMTVVGVVDDTAHVVWNDVNGMMHTAELPQAALR